MTYDNFLGLPEEHSREATARVIVVPIPYEATVSYGKGTADGPRALISASQQVELYDREYDREPAIEYGVHTLAPLELPAAPSDAIAVIADAIHREASRGKFIVALGGEHTVSVGVGRGLARAIGEPITVVQIDAHADLRDEYEGNRFSHACIARRLLEEQHIEQIIQFGVRSICREEVDVIKSETSRLRTWYVEEAHAGAWRRELCDRVRGRKVYLTIDVDGLDPAIIAATGTPEPDGLLWNQVLDIIRTVAQCGQVVGMDCVELAPSPGLHASEYAAAKLIYKAFTYALTHGLQAEEAARARTQPVEHGYGGLANEPDLWPDKGELPAP